MGIMKICPACESEFDDAAAVCPHDGTKLVHVDTTSGPEPDPLVGRMFTDRIRLDTRIGEGGMGAVYKGEDILLGRTVAVKVLHQNLKKSADDVKRFFNEAKVVAKLRHSNTIQVFDFGESKSGHYYIAMEYMTGEPLDGYADKVTSLARVFEIMEQICLSLEEAHSLGIIHRDLKPDNIFIDTVNNRRLVKVIDFGIAKMLSGGENLTQAGMVFGTPAYMSPEQARGDKLDPRSDVYSLGVVMFFLLTGRQPFVGANAMEVAVQHITREPPSVAEMSRFGALPAELAKLTHDMLSKERDTRPQTIADVRRRLLDIARATPEVRIDPSRQTGTMVHVRTERNATTRTEIGGTGLDTTDRLSHDDDVFPPVRSKAPLFMGIGAAALAVIGVLAFVLTRGGDETPGPGDESPGAEVVEPTPETTPTPEPPAETPPEVAAVPEPPAFSQASTSLGAAQTAATTAAAAQVVTVSITSTPVGATVALADTGDVLGTTPVTWHARRADQTRNVRISHDGYRDAAERVSLAGDGQVNATLRAERTQERPVERDPRPDRQPDPVVVNTPDPPPPVDPEPTDDGDDGDDEPSGTPSFLGGGVRAPVTITE